MSTRIFLLVRPHLDLDSVSAFLEHEARSWARSEGAGESEEIIELAGRICYMSFGNRQSPRSNGEYIKNLIAMRHESVLEHATWTFAITGVSRALTHQLVRHRVGFSFSQLSQQYCDETDASFVEPPGIRSLPEAKTAWDRSVTASREAYTVILSMLQKAGMTEGLYSKKEFDRLTRSIARGVLPNSTETKIVVTANARALRYFLEVRGSIPGDLEMRQVAVELLRILKREAPALFFDFQIEDRPDGPIVVYCAE